MLVKWILFTFPRFSEVNSELVIVDYTSIVVSGNYNKYTFAFPFALIALGKKNTIVFQWLSKRETKYSEIDYEAEKREDVRFAV